MIPSPVPLDDLFAQLPPKDRSYACNLADPDAVSRWALLRAEIYRRHRVPQMLGAISTLCSIHNALLPINRLPTEMLSQVVADPVLDCHDLAVTQVSRYWRAVVLHTPQFWANVLASARFRRSHNVRTAMCAQTDEPCYLCLCFSRSGALPLRIEGYVQASTWKHFVDAKDRLFDLDIQSLRSWDALQDLISLKMTRLMRLRIFELLYKKDPDVKGIRLNPQDLPHLRNLSFAKCRLYSVSADFLTLTHLDLCEVDYSLSRLMGVLKRCPRLESLALSSITINTEVEAMDLPLGSVDRYNANKLVALPQLRTLSIHPLKEALLLTSLTFPSTTRLCLRIPDEYSSLLKAVPPWILSSIDSAYLHIAIGDGLRSTVTFLCYVQQHEKLRLTTNFRDVGLFNDEMDIVQHHTPFLNSFQSILITTLSLDLPHKSYGRSSADLSAWLSLVLEVLPQVHTLELLSFADNRESKRDTAERFLLDREERNVVDLALVWALPPEYRLYGIGTEFLRDYEESESGPAAMELQGLLEMLRARDNVGKARLQRLELRKPDHRVDLFDLSKNDYQPPCSTPGSYDNCVIAELRKLVHELVLDLS